MNIGSEVAEKMKIESIWSMVGWFCQKIIPLHSPSCKTRLARLSYKLRFQDGPSVEIIYISNLGRLTGKYELGINIQFNLLDIFL